MPGVVSRGILRSSEDHNTCMSPKRPQDLTFTLFGEYLEHLGRPVWVGNLIARLRPFPE